MKQGRYMEAENSLRKTCAVYRRAYGPESPFTSHCTYQLAGLAAAQGLRQRALSMLRQAVDNGLNPVTAMNIEQDEDLKALHGDPGFAAVVAHAKQVAAQHTTNQR